MTVLWIMGCGQSKPKVDNNEATDPDDVRSVNMTKSKSENSHQCVSENGSKSSISCDDAGGSLKSSSSHSIQRVPSASSNGNVTPSAGEPGHTIDQVDSSRKKKSAFNEKSSSSGGVLHTVRSKASGSQLEFFRMLDEKIEKGIDYDANGET